MGKKTQIADISDMITDIVLTASMTILFIITWLYRWNMFSYWRDYKSDIIVVHWLAYLQICTTNHVSIMIKITVLAWKKLGYQHLLVFKNVCLYFSQCPPQSLFFYKMFVCSAENTHRLCSFKAQPNKATYKCHFFCNNNRWFAS